MKGFLLFFITILSGFVLAQKEVNGAVTAGDSVVIEINSIQPADFPEVEVLFKANSPSGYPYWGLEKKSIRVYENDDSCEVTHLSHFTERVPIKLMVVLDHSGSMGQDMWSYLEMNPEVNLDSLFNSPDTTWYEDIPYALKDAVKAIQQFVPNFNSEKDEIGLITFSVMVDEILPVGSSIEKINSVLDTIQPFASTAFYDALYTGVQELGGKDGIKVVIALTDGFDNSSTKSPYDVIDFAKKEEVAMYCVGLGNVEKDTLEMISDSTNGFFIYTDNSSSLDSVYNLLEKKIKAYYLLKYNSLNWSSDLTERGFKLKFDVKDVNLFENESTYELPEDVIQYLKSKEDREFYILAGSIGTFVILSIGIGVYFIRRKSKKQLKIVRVYPNPGNGIIKMEVELPESEGQAEVQIADNRGNVILNSSVLNGQNELNISNRLSGLYLIQISKEGYKSDERKYFKK